MAPSAPSLCQSSVQDICLPQHSYDGQKLNNPAQNKGPQSAAGACFLLLPRYCDTLRSHKTLTDPHEINSIMGAGL